MGRSEAAGAEVSAAEMVGAAVSVLEMAGAIENGAALLGAKATGASEFKAATDEGADANDDGAIVLIPLEGAIVIGAIESEERGEPGGMSAAMVGVTLSTTARRKPRRNRSHDGGSFIVIVFLPF